MTTPAVSAYSTTPANNTQANTGVNWDEGMSPAAVNNSARQNMADLRSFANDLIWFQYGSGTSPVVAPVYVGATQFKISGVDVSTPYHVGRRVKAVGSTTGTIYGRISTVAFSTDTTVTVVWDSGSLSNETLTIYLSQVPVTGTPISSKSIQQGANFFNAAVSDPTGTTSTASIKMMGVGSTWTITPILTGNLRVIVTGTSNNTTANDGCAIQVRYGTGSAPANGDAQTGTQAARNKSTSSAANSQLIDFTITAQITGLTVGTAYWFDMGLAAVTGGTANLTNLSIQIVEY